MSDSNINIIYYDSLPSTNDTAKEAAKNGVPAGTIIMAGSQSKGKGRNGRSFFSPANQGLYMSIIARTTLPATFGVSITVAAAVAVHKALAEEYSILTEIKWVNDLLLNKKKVCGILAEGIGLHSDKNSGEAKFDSIIIGIGINLYQDTEFPEDLKEKAGTLSLNRLQIDEKKQLAAKITDILLKEISQMEQYHKSGADLFGRDFVSYYNAHSAVKDKKVTVSQPVNGNAEALFTENAIAREINGNGSLLAEYQDGTCKYLSSGEVSLAIN